MNTYNIQPTEISGNICERVQVRTIGKKLEIRYLFRKDELWRCESSRQLFDWDERDKFLDWLDFSQAGIRPAEPDRAIFDFLLPESDFERAVE